jgi:acetyltransferase-like isoleucine patch superfamily enzyme
VPLKALLAKFRHRKLVRDLRQKGWIAADAMIRGSLDIRAAGGSIRIGQGSLIEGLLATERPESKITIARNVYVGGGTVIDCIADISIGEDVLVSYGCVITDSDNHSVRYSIRKNDCADWRRGFHDWSTHEHRPVIIGKGAWIGAHAMVLKGVELGEGTIVAAGSVVSKSVAPYTIVAGNPAKIVRELGPNER